MEQSTMLEPSNNVGGPKFDNDEEMREISGQLGALKKKHDVAKKKVNHLEEELDRVKKEIDQLNTQQTQAETVVYETSAKIEQLNTAIATTKLKFEEEQMSTSIYSHMKARMKRDLLEY